MRVDARDRGADARQASAGPSRHAQRHQVRHPGGEAEPVRRGLRRQLDRGAKTIDEANATIDDVDAMLAKRVDAALANSRRNETAQAKTDAQIRNFVRSLPALGKMDSKGRLEWILTAIDDGDHEAVAAVLGAPCFVSGLDRQQHAMVREHAARKFAPTEVTQREALAKVRQRLSEASQHYLSTYIDIIPPRADRKADESLKRLREGVAA
jgi:hypothetical protein